MKEVAERFTFIVVILLAAVLVLGACSPSQTDQEQAAPQEETASTPDIEFHRLKVEPVVHSTYPTSQRFKDGLAPQVLVITAEGLEQIGLEDRPEKASWMLRLSEQIYVNGKKLHYQVGMQWNRKEAAWSYTDAPVKDVNGLWTKDPRSGGAEADPRLPGRHCPRRFQGSPLQSGYHQRLE